MSRNDLPRALVCLDSGTHVAKGSSAIFLTNEKLLFTSLAALYKRSEAKEKFILIWKKLPVKFELKKRFFNKFNSY